MRFVDYRGVVVGLLCLALAFAVNCTTEAEEPSPVPQELLMGMAQFVAGQPRLGVSVRAGYDVLQDDGQMLEFLESRTLVVERPARFYAQSLGGGDSVLFDGADMTVYHAGADVYAQVEQPGSLDDAVLYFTRELGMRLPLASMLTQRFPQELERRLQDASYVELSGAFPIPAHHVAGRLRDVDFQAWIAVGTEPWPLRLVLTYRGEPGHPQYWADFTGWTTQPAITPDTFRFQPGAGAQRIVFAVQVPERSSATQGVDGDQP